MQQFWVPASKALSLIARGMGDYPAILAICERAHAGLLASRAQFYIALDQRLEQVPIPTEFWWAEGHEALEQDWIRGDFSTWIDRKFRLQAFGVQFEFEGLRLMISTEGAAAALRELSVGADAAWVSGREARRFMYERLGANPAAAELHVLDQCRLGFLPGRAQLFQRSNSGQPNRWSFEEREWDIPDWFWSNFTNVGSSSQDWDRGLFNGKGRAPDGSCWIRLTGVHFLRVALEALLPDSGPALEDANPTNKGGRPRKEWWDDLWCGVWGQVYRGALLPKTQADLERAMIEWVEDRGKAVSESTIRPLARKMFLEMQREGGN